MTEYRINKVHFIGIGGVGMSGIARVAKEKGMEVSGSDLRESRYTQQLREAGVTVFIGQSASNLEGLDPDVVVVSTAILENNAEFIEAKKRNLPIWHRAKMLAALGVGHDTLAVARHAWQNHYFFHAGIPYSMPWASIPRSLSVASFVPTVRTRIAEKANTMW